jgi:hypothetical protein
VNPREIFKMNFLLDRVITNWKTTASGVLAVAAICVGAFVATGYTGKGFTVAGLIITGLTGLIAKDA